MVDLVGYIEFIICDVDNDGIVYDEDFDGGLLWYYLDVVIGLIKIFYL